MAFNEIRFPEHIAYGARGGPGYNTSIVSSDSGFEYRTIKWSQAKRKYQVGYAVTNLKEMQEVVEFYVCMYGPGDGFRFKDWSDYSTAKDWDSERYPGIDDVTAFDAQIGVGDDSQVSFQLLKIYEAGNLKIPRTIKKPLADSVKVAVDGVELTSGWNVDSTTGIVTFDSPPSDGDIITAGCEFDVPVRFGDASDDALEAIISGFNAGSVPDIPLIEILDTSPSYQDFPKGGSGEFLLTQNKTLTLAEGVVQAYDVQSSGLHVKLPDPTNMEGGRIFTLINKGSSNQLTIRDENDVSLINLSTGSGIDAYLIKTVTGKKWVVLG